MKILYGVQGTGNGHITRARVMARELYHAGNDVTFLFTGRPKDTLFDMGVFNHFEWRKGLTFNTDKGQVNYIKTVLDSHPIQFIQDIKSLDLSEYDLIISDFEPVTAWAAKTRKAPILAIGHQYAFQHAIPKIKTDPLAELVMKYFAPSDYNIGLHWHHFNQPILPPIIETPTPPQFAHKNKILVYLPFENQHQIIKLLAPFQDFDFHIYAPTVIHCPESHILVKSLSREGFQKDLYDSAGIISNAGFELASETLQLGKRLLAKPLHMQMEQLSNALALAELNYGSIMKDLDSSIIEPWLYDSRAVRINYPNVARYIVQWINDGMPTMNKNWTDTLWNSVKVEPIVL